MSSRTPVRTAFPIAVSAILVAGALAALFPTVEAHTCEAQKPKRSCGECLDGTHYHVYTSGKLYCRSYSACDGARAAVYVHPQILDRVHLERLCAAVHVVEYSPEGLVELLTDGFTLA